MRAFLTEFCANTFPAHIATGLLVLLWFGRHFERRIVPPDVAEKLQVNLSPQVTQHAFRIRVYAVAALRDMLGAAEVLFASVADLSNGVRFIALFVYSTKTNG
jgi:hypothetical protein